MDLPHSLADLIEKPTVVRDDEERPLPPLPALDAYIKGAAPEFDILRKIQMPKHCIVSDDDTHVPPELTLDMADKLKSPVTHIAQGGHLMASDGFTELPQAWAVAVPAVGANILFLMKETSVVSAVGIAELLFVTKDIIGMDYKTNEALFLLFASYLIILLPVSLSARWAEKRVRSAKYGA